MDHLDLIIVLNEGKVYEQGTHDELLRRGGLYYDMWLEQAADSFASGDAEKELEDVAVEDVEQESKDSARQP